MGVVMRSALTWVCLGLLANTATATLSQEAIDELEEELKAAADATGDYGLFVDPAENELFDLLQNDGQGDDGDVFRPDLEPTPEAPPATWAGDSSEVIESIDEIESITPIKSIQEVKSIKPVKSIEEIKSITPIKSIQEVKSIKKVKSILPVPDDIAQKFIADHNLVPMDGDATYKEYENPPTVGGGPPSSLRQRLEAVIDTLNELVQEVDTNPCAQVPDYEPLPDPEPGPAWKDSTNWNTGTKLPFDKEDIKSIDEITSMQEVKSMLPVKSIEEVKSITPIKSIQEVTGLYELNDEQDDLMRRLNAKWSKGGARRNRRRRRF